jgi:hypothetical protein
MNNHRVDGQTKRTQNCNRQNMNVAMNAKNTLNLLYCQHQISTRLNFKANEFAKIKKKSNLKK